MTQLYIGVDDTDSSTGMCTTYIAVQLIKKIKLDLIGYPRLVRLNPNIPWKTRGNGAIALKFGVGAGAKIFVGNISGKPVYAYSTTKKTDFGIELYYKIAERLVEQYSIMQDIRTNPGIVITLKKPRERLYWAAVRGVVNIKDIERELKQAYIKKYKTGRGIIGAAAAIAWRARARTYELITYLNESQWTEDRWVDKQSVIEMDQILKNSFDNFDYLNDYIAIMPHARTPVLFGIRGTHPEMLFKGLNMIKSDPYESYLMFETNQGTDDHIVSRTVSKIQEYENVVIEGTVTSNPKTIAGGHVLFKIKDFSGTITCAAYEPTKQFRRVISALHKGDKVRVFGAKRAGKCTINLEKIEIQNLVTIKRNIPPLCPICHKKMESAGKGKGYKCKRCKTRSFEGQEIIEPRVITTGYYEVPVIARRHLSKPLKLMQ